MTTDPVGLADLLTRSASRFPHNKALVDGHRVTTYAALDEGASRFAGALDVQPRSRVALLLSNDRSFAEAYYGALRVGATVVPLNPLLKREEVASRLRHSAASVLVTTDARKPELASLGIRTITAGSWSTATAAAARSVDPEATAVVLYTSGTINAPKGVELSHVALLSTSRALGTALDVDEFDVVLGAAPLAHVFGQCAVLNMSVAAGASIALMARFEAREALELLAREHVTVFLGVPTMCLALLDASDQATLRPRLRVAHVGASPFRIEAARRFSERFGCDVLEGYGLTEAGGTVTTHHTGRIIKPGSVGQSIDGCDVRLDGPSPSEILVRGPGVMRGYLDADDATAAVVQDGWLHTGDIGHIDEDGYVYLVGRSKDVILRAGHTVYPQELEEVMCGHPNVLEALVLGMPDARLGEEVAALVVPREQPCDVDELRDYMRERVAPYKYPRLIVAVDELPHGSTGKIERRRIDPEVHARLLRQLATR